MLHPVLSFCTWRKKVPSKGFSHPLKHSLSIHQTLMQRPDWSASKRASILISSMPGSALTPPVYASAADRMDQWVCEWMSERTNASEIYWAPKLAAVFRSNAAQVAPPKCQNRRHCGLGTCLGWSARFLISNLHLHRQLSWHISGWFKEFNRTEEYCLPR